MSPIKHTGLLAGLTLFWSTRELSKFLQQSSSGEWERVFVLQKISEAGYLLIIWSISSSVKGGDVFVFLWVEVQ